METPTQIFPIELPLKAVHIQCLDENKVPIEGANASGFICIEDEASFLYTCWHVVTGYDMHNLKTGRDLPNRTFLRVTLQQAKYQNLSKEGIPPFEVSSVGGVQEIDLPLYHSRSKPFYPAWHQEETDLPKIDLNAIGIRVPKWHDAIKIPLPKDVRLSSMQTINVQQRDLNSPMPGDQLFIVGYPFGYSPVGMTQPTAIVLTRHLAAMSIEGRIIEVLLDGAGAPGMSGGPVFARTESGIRLIGIYTGLIYPDHVIKKSERVTALGTYCPLSLCWRHMPLIPYVPASISDSV